MPTTTPGRNNLDTTTSGSAVIVKALQGTGINLSATGVDAGTGDVTIGLAVPVAVANGGTGATTALAARGSTGLNIESRVTMNNASLTGTSTDNYIGTTTTAFTAQRTYTLPPANSQNPGEKIYIGDDGGAINGAFNLVIARAGTDTIHGGTAPITLLSPRSSIVLATDGVSNWQTVQRSPSVRIQVITSGTTFTTTVGAKAMWVECIGGGGGGGGALGSAVPGCGLGGGGAGGGYGATYIVNPGGAGGTGAAIGSNGTNTTFDSPSVCTGGFGQGGLNLATGNTQLAVLGISPTVSVGDFQMGSYSSPGYRFSGTFGVAGQGGFSPRGGGQSQARAGQNDGTSGVLYGGGGGGACSFSTTAQTGGPGAAGCIIVTEFF